MDSIYDLQHSVMKTCLSKCIHVLNHNWYKKLKPNRKETLQKFWLHSVELSRSIITFIVADKMIQYKEYLTICNHSFCISPCTATFLLYPGREQSITDFQGPLLLTGINFNPGMDK